MGKHYINVNPKMDRRAFTKGLGMSSAGLVMATLGGCESILEQIETRPVRYRLRTGSSDVDNVVEIYKDAVNAMRALPSSDPRSWDAQSGIHGTVLGGFNFCEHGSDHFFSWHRAYLFFFEQICQNLTGEDDFGLPYWNWNQDPQMHPEFTDPASPLNHPRNLTDLTGFPEFTDATLDPMFTNPDFYTFSSLIEGSPHDVAHIRIGQDMVTGGSSQDPVFWVHHCMADYCWAKWNLELGNDMPNDPAWQNTSWSHFTDGNGDPAEMTALSTSLMPVLSFRYESSAIGSNPATARLAAAELKTAEERIRKGTDVRFEVKRQVPIANRAELTMGRTFSSPPSIDTGALRALIESDQTEEQIFARVRYAELPETNDFFVRVFINLPDANIGTPTTNPHYAGSFAFFGTRSGHGDHGEDKKGKTEFLVYVSDTLQRLRSIGRLGDGEPISVQLVAVPIGEQLEAPNAELLLEQVDLIVSPIQIRAE